MDNTQVMEKLEALLNKLELLVVSVAEIASIIKEREKRFAERGARPPIDRSQGRSDFRSRNDRGGNGDSSWGNSSSNFGGRRDRNDRERKG